MQIVVNTRLLIENKLDGMGWFTYQTLKRISQHHPEVHFVFLFDRDFSPEFIFADNVTPIILAPQARHPILYYCWFQFSVKKILKKLKPDLFLSPDGFLVLGAKCKQLAVIHDINFLHYPKDVKWLSAYYYNYFFPRFAKIATRIATVSEFSKQEISKHYQISPNRIDVVYNGINDFIRPSTELEKTEIKSRFTLGEDYFIHIGSLSPRKNILNLVKAFSKFKSEKKSKMKLVLAGAGLWGLKEIHQIIDSEGLKGDVILTGRLSNEDLNLLLASSSALLLLSYYEGFGIPLIEAMQAEVPIICSNVSSLPEVVGEAAILVDPFNLDEIKNAMTKMLSDPLLRDNLIANARLQKQKFSWNRSADLLWESMMKAVNSNSTV